MRLKQNRRLDQLFANVDEPVSVRGREKPIGLGILCPCLGDRRLVGDLVGTESALRRYRRQGQSPVTRTVNMRIQRPSCRRTLTVLKLWLLVAIRMSAPTRL